jgi:hypothetical protein
LVYLSNEYTAMKKVISLNLVLIFLLSPHSLVFAQYTGGSGKGDATASVANASVFNRWDNTQNNRVLTRTAYNSAIEIGVFTANSLTNDLRAISANTISASSYSPATLGIDAMYTTKNSSFKNQLLIKGDFRSIRIDPSTGQIQCSARPSYSQLLWLNDDIIALGTQCFTDKTLQTAYSPSSTTAWFNIQNGKAIQINSSGVITALCN